MTILKFYTKTQIFGTDGDWNLIIQHKMLIRLLGGVKFTIIYPQLCCKIDEISIKTYCLVKLYYLILFSIKLIIEKIINRINDTVCRINVCKSESSSS